MYLQLYKRIFYLLPMALVMCYPFVRLMQFPLTLPLLAAVCMLLVWLKENNLAAIGFKKIGWKELVNKAFFSFFMVEITFDFLLQPALNYFFNATVNYNEFDFLKANAAAFLLYLLQVFIKTALSEEIIYRGFLFYLAEKLTGNKWMAVVASSIGFGLAHIHRGWNDVVIAFFFGFVFSIIYLKSKHNIWVCIAAHAMLDGFFLTIAYLGKLHFFETPFEFFKHLSCVQ